MNDRFVLTFHGIGPVPDWCPKDEAPFWATEDAFRNCLDRACVARDRFGADILVTFDDGNRSDLAHGAPALAERGLPGAFFPCAGRIGDARYLDADGLRKLRDGGFELGSHGMDHVRWADIDPSRRNDEIRRSKSILSEALGAEIISAALPFGSYGRAVIRDLKAAGYKRVYSSDPGPARPGAFFQYRWSYRADREFDPVRIVREGRGLHRRLLSRGKHFLKARR